MKLGRYNEVISMKLFCNERKLTSNAATVTTLWKEGIRRSILRYRSTSAIAASRRVTSSGVWSLLPSDFVNSPRSGGDVETVAQARAVITEEI